MGTGKSGRSAAPPRTPAPDFGEPLQTKLRCRDRRHPLLVSQELSRLVWVAPFPAKASSPGEDDCEVFHVLTQGNRSARFSANPGARTFSPTKSVLYVSTTRRSTHRPVARSMPDQLVLADPLDVLRAELRGHQRLRRRSNRCVSCPAKVAGYSERPHLRCNLILLRSTADRLLSVTIAIFARYSE